VGTGVIGASWAAFFLAKGFEVVAADPAPGAEERLREFVAKAWPALERLGLSLGASQSRLTFTADLGAALQGVAFVQEKRSARPVLKKSRDRQVDALLPPDVIIAGSSPGLPMSKIQVGATAHPERTVTGHPFNPPHLIPLVEIVGGKLTSEETIQRADDFYAS